MSTHIRSPQQVGKGDDSQQDTPHPERSTVVGVDHRGRSVSALVWAVEEAERRGTAVTLVSAGQDEVSDRDPAGQHDLATLARRLTLTGIRRREVVGDPVDALLDAASEADLLVVGCRSMRPSLRMLLGSTSRAVARWSPVPVVVVPEAWIQPSLAVAPLVAGVRPTKRGEPPKEEETDREVLDFAFTRAAALNVPLAIVSAWEIPAVRAWSPSDIERLRAEHDESLERRIGPWQETYPEVEVSFHSVAEKPAQALLEASQVAQLVVVGRHHAAALSGILGSTAQAVLRHASRPVAVVPAGTREELFGDLDAHRKGTDRPWGPIV